MCDLVGRRSEAGGTSDDFDRWVDVHEGLNELYEWVTGYLGFNA
jgi:hypothetical protein